MKEQQGDVQLFQTDNNGDICVENGIVSMSGGLETSAYLSLFGGNSDDPGGSDESKTWWGNLSETVPSRRYRSLTQNLLDVLPLTTLNLRRIEDAARDDLAWMVGEQVASSVTVLATIPGLNTIKLAITIEALGREELFEFTENWKSSV